MMSRHGWITWSCWLCIVVGVQAEPGKSASMVGKTVEDFELREVRTRQPVRLVDPKHPAKATVVLFLGTACPINNAYLPTLNRMQATYSAQGVRFIGINPNAQDSLTETADHANANEIAFPMVKDFDQRIADRFGARRTPEAFVLDGQRVIRYHGRIDDQFGIDYKKLRPTTRELADAIEAVLAGKPVAVAETAAPGCLIGRTPKHSTKPSSGLTFTKHIVPILQKYCQECHRPGQIGPMPLQEYSDVAAWSEMIREVIENRRMPPWHADNTVAKYSNDRSLPDEARLTLRNWIDEGCVQGDAKDLPPPIRFDDSGWRIGKPDLILKMETEYAVPAETPPGGIPYQLFVLDPGFREDKWVIRAEAKPGAPEVVHHILAYIVPPLEEIDPEYPNFPFLPGARNARVLCGTAPGDMPMIFPEGAAIRIPKGSKIVLQMHYTPDGKARKDRSQIGLVFAKELPEREVMTIPVFNGRLRIPPRADNHRVESNFVLRHDGKIFNLMPHMHLRGKSFEMYLIDSEGKSIPLLNVPKYDFNWQTVYRLETPVAFRAGWRVKCVAHYDNSAKNPLNPDPNRFVGWGDQTWQEMMIGWMDIVYDRTPRSLQRNAP